MTYGRLAADEFCCVGSHYYKPKLLSVITVTHINFKTFLNEGFTSE